MKSQENINLGENTEEVHAIKGYIQKVKIEENKYQFRARKSRRGK